MSKKRLAYSLLGLIGVIAIISLALSTPIIQNEDYHNFSDNLIVGGILNFWNVFSNLPILIVGFLGIVRLYKIQKLNLQFLIFFIGISLVAFGSAYYHYKPNNTTLIWDRLPMTIAFTALISIIISDFIDFRIGKILLFPLLFIGIVSILYWVTFGDLRLYVLVQFYPILAMPIILILFNSKSNNPRGYWLLLIAYIIAKIFETYDIEIHNTLIFISGHSLKHIMIAIGIYLLIMSLIRQNKTIANNMPAGGLHTGGM